MNIEQKAKAYDKAVEKAREYWKTDNDNTLDIKARGTMEYLFPELKESEDEKIRTAIIHFISHTPTIPKGVIDKETMIAWLEKQTTPQVRTGLEWVNTIDDACDERYAEEYSHGEYCHEQSFKWGFQEGVEWLEKQAEQKPTNEDMKTLLRTEYEKGRADAIAEMQKEWSEEDSYYRNCIIQTIEEINNAPLKRLEDWDAYINWLKSLGPQQPKQEWNDKKNEYEKLKNSSEEVTKNKENAKDFLESSGIMDKDEKLAPQYRLNEEDEVYYNDICEMLTNLLCSKKADINKNAIQKDINWLQSIKPQNRWKPSDEQMEALYTYIYNPQYFNSPDSRMELVESVYKDLKKLKD